VKKLADLTLPQNVRDALRAAQERLNTEFNIDRILLFGSVVRGTADEESDVDLLIVLRETPDHPVRNRISSIILDINLEHDANLSGLVVDQKAWDEGLVSVLPIHEDVEEEGIPL